MGNKVMGWIFVLGGVFFGIATYPLFVSDPEHETGRVDFALLALWVVLTLGIIICGIAFIRIKKRSKK